MICPDRDLENFCHIKKLLYLKNVIINLILFKCKILSKIRHLDLNCRSKSHLTKITFKCPLIGCSSSVYLYIYEILNVKNMRCQNIYYYIIIIIYYSYCCKWTCDFFLLHYNGPFLLPVTHLYCFAFMHIKCHNWVDLVSHRDRFRRLPF